MSQIRVRVQGKNDVGIPLVNVWYYEGHHDTEPRDNPAVFKYDTFTDRVGNTGWPIPEWRPREFTCFVNTFNVQPQYASGREFLVPRADGSFPDYEIFLSETGALPPPGPTPAPTGKLDLRSSELFYADGRRAFMRGADAFCAYEIYLRSGPSALKDVFAELKTRYRVNCLRWWTMSANLQQNEFGRPPFDPRSFPDYYPRFREFVQWVGQDFFSYIGLFPDVQIISPDAGWQQSHWDQLKAICEEESSVFAVEFQNEAGAKDFNKLSPGFQTRNPRCIWVGTSYSDADDAYRTGTLPVNDLGTGPAGDVHTSRRYPAQILDNCPANNVYFKMGKGLMLGEPDRFGWRGNPNRRQAELAAPPARAGGLGIIFHSMRGERCEALTSDPDTQNTADGWFSAFEAI